MPIVDFECTKCGHVQEAFTNIIKDECSEKCEKCGCKELKRHLGIAKRISMGGRQGIRDVH